MEVRNLSIDVRNRLRSLFYDEDFSIDSVNLVNRLLTDLQSKSQSFDQLQERDNRLAADLTAQAQLFPLRRENAKLARENNELHKDQIKQTDDSRAFSEEQSRTLRKVEDELVESKLKYQSIQAEYVGMAQNLDRIREAYGLLMEQKGASSTRGMKSNLKVNTLNLPVASGSKKRISSSLKSDVELIDTLRSQNEALSTALHTADDDNKRLHTAIAAREQELTRSSRMVTVLSAGQTDTQNTSAESSNRTEQLLSADLANKRIIDQLNGQVDFLNEQLARSQEELRQAGSKIRQYDSTKSELAQRTVLLDESRRSQTQSTSHIRALEQKILDLGQQIGLLKAKDIVLQQTADGGGDRPETKLTDQKEEHTRLLHDKDLIVGKLNSERVQLLEEVERLRRVNEVLSNSSNSTSNKSINAKGGRLGGRLVTGQSLNSLQQTAKSDALVVSLNKEVESLKARLATLTKSLTGSQDSCRLLEEQKAALEHRLKMHDSTRDRSDILRANQDLQERLTRSEALSEDLTRDRDHLKGLLDQTRLDTSNSRRLHGEAELDRQRLEYQVSLLSGELSGCQSLLTSNKSELTQSRELSVQQREQLDEQHSIVDLLTRKNEQLQSEHLRLLEANKDLSRQRVEAARSLSQHHSEAASSSTADQLSSDNRRLQSRVEELEGEVRRWTADLEPVLQYLRVDHNSHRMNAMAAGEERRFILESLKDRDNSLSSLQLDLAGLRQELSKRESILDAQESAVARLREEYLSCQAMCRRQTGIAEQLQADNILLQQRVALQHGDVDQVHQQSETLQSTLTQTGEFLSMSRREVHSLTGQLQQSQEKLIAAENALATHKQQADQIHRRQRSGQQDVQSLLLEKADLENRLQEYKLLLSNTDAGTRAHTQQMEALSARVRSGEQSEQRLERELASLKVVLNDRNGSIQSLQRNLESLDAERDRLQELLDTADERETQTVLMTRQMESGGAQLQQIIHQLEKKLSTSTKELASAHRQNAVIEARLNTNQNELVQMERRSRETQSKVDEAVRDLQLMTRENQALTSELVSASAERERLKARVGELMQSLAGAQQSFRALEVEKNDLLETYRSVIKDKRRMEGDLGAMSALKHQEGLNGQQLADQLNECHSIINAYKSGERKWVGEKVSLSKQLEALNDQLLRAGDRLQQMEIDKRQVIQDTTSLKQTNAMLNERITLILTRATSAIESNKMLTAQLGKTERECSAVRSLLQLEKQRTEEQMQITTAMRAHAARESLGSTRSRSGETSPSPTHGGVQMAHDTHHTSSTAQSHSERDAGADVVETSTTIRTVHTTSSSSVIQQSSDHTHVRAVSSQSPPQ